MTKDSESGRSPADILAGVAVALAEGDAVVWRRLLADHVPDPTGRCPACRQHGVSGPIWPCTLRSVAEHAQRLTTARRPSPDG